MAALADVFAAVRLQLDGTGFEAQATALADKQGKNVGERMSNQLNSKLKSAAAGVAGMAAGAAFGVMLTGANQLDAATRQLQADTGMTADEAKRAQGALASMYRDNLQGFDAIGAAMAKVHNDLGLTGDAADAMTAKFLKFSTATKQDAAASVAKFDDILDAWNLTAADAGSLMDKLIVSHQKYGGVIAESESALAAMAPAMQAANMSIDDGIALLNLFNAAGIDASKAPAALAKAVKQLKPGQGLNDLIAQISAVEDPTLRGQKAMEIFGARSGIGLAQAIKPGMTSLADLTASLGDTTDATTKAAEASLSWGDKATLAMHKVGGVLAEFGTQFGPLLMVAATIGPKFTTALLSGLGGLAGLFGPKLLALILPEAVATGLAAGTASGTAFGTALAAAAAVAAIALPVTIILAATGPVADFLGLSGKQTGPAGTWSPKLGGPFKTPEVVVPVVVKPDEETSAQAYRDYLAALPDPGAGLDYGEWKKGAAAGGTAAGAAAGDAFADGLRTSGGGSWGAVAADQVVAMFGDRGMLSDVKAAALKTGADGMFAMAQGITSARAKPLDAFDTLKEMLKNALTPVAEQARLAGELTSKELARGLRSKDPAVRAQAIAVKETILGRLRELREPAHGFGTKAMDELRKGLRSKDPEIRAAAAAAMKVATDKLNATPKAAGTAGEAVGTAFAKGVKAKVTSILDWVSSIHANPDVSITVVRRGGMVAAAAGMPYVPTNMPVYVHEREAILSVPQAEAWRAGTGGAGGNTYQVNVTGLVKARDPLEIATQMRRLARFGVLTPKAVPA